MSPSFTILDGLPPYGSEAIAFPQGQLLAREGLVVRFDISNDRHWVGNFKRGRFDISKVLNHPDGKRLVVCAGGNIYFVDPEKNSVTGEFDSYVLYAEELPQFNTVLMGNSDKFFAINADGVQWTTDRIAWDGFRSIKLSKNILTGEAFSPIDDKWHSFEVDVQTGLCKGSVYEEQLARFVPIVRKD